MGEVIPLCKYVFVHDSLHGKGDVRIVACSIAILTGQGVFVVAIAYNMDGSSGEVGFPWGEASARLRAFSQYNATSVAVTVPPRCRKMFSFARFLAGSLHTVYLHNMPSAPPIGLSPTTLGDSTGWPLALCTYGDVIRLCVIWPTKHREAQWF